MKVEVEAGWCPDCGCAADLFYERQRRGDGEVAHEQLMRVQCTNPDCHA